MRLACVVKQDPKVDGHLKAGILLASVEPLRGRAHQPHTAPERFAQILACALRGHSAPGGSGMTCPTIGTGVHPRARPRPPQNEALDESPASEDGDEVKATAHNDRQ